jgi:hypothetical protein
MGGGGGGPAVRGRGEGPEAGAGLSWGGESARGVPWWEAILEVVASSLCSRLAGMGHSGRTATTQLLWEI